MCMEAVMLAFGVWGVYALLSGRFWVSKGQVVTGRPARILGVMCLSFYPLSAMLVLLLTMSLLALGLRTDVDKAVLAGAFIEAGVLLSVLGCLDHLMARFRSGASALRPLSALLLFMSIAACTALDVLSYGFPYRSAVIGSSLWGLVIGLLGGAGFSWCIFSELRRLSRQPAGG